MLHSLRLPVAIATVAALVGVAAASMPPVAIPAEPADDTGFGVEGYLIDDEEAGELLERDADAITLVGIDGVNLRRSGTGITWESGVAVEAAADAGVATELLLGNYDTEYGDFSPKLASLVLKHRDNRRVVVDKTVERVVEGGYGGLQLDLESLNRSHLNALVKFAKNLREALPAQYPISMAIMAADSPSGYRDWGYDIPRLSAYIDRFVLMAYSQHGPGWSGPGPVGADRWTLRVLDGLLETGLDPRSIDLGVAQYGNVWPGDGSRGRPVSVRKARDLAGDRARFDETKGEWTATLTSGTVIWWSDARTLRARVAVAKDAGLHGIAMWELGLADPLDPDDTGLGTDSDAEWARG